MGKCLVCWYNSKRRFILESVHYWTIAGHNPDQVGHRDGLQCKKVLVSTSVELEFNSCLLSAGLTHVEATSYICAPHPEVSGHDHVWHGLLWDLPEGNYIRKSIPLDQLDGTYTKGQVLANIHTALLISVWVLSTYHRSLGEREYRGCSLHALWHAYNTDRH